MVEIVPTYNELPIEVGKTYRTKFQTGEMFTVTKIVEKGGKILWFEGIYGDHAHVGVCPIGNERLIPERVLSGGMDVCSYCKMPI
jgi:hypothetical protein